MQTFFSRKAGRYLECTVEERRERVKIYCVGNACEGNYSQFVLSRPQGSARIAKPLMHECSKELNKLRKEKDSMCWYNS